MKPEALGTAARAAALELTGARGLVACVADTDTVWGEYMAAIRAALASRERPEHALRRDEFAAVWLGTGPAETWLSAGVALLQGPASARGVAARGGPAGDGAKELPAGAVSAAAWVQRLVRDATSDVQRLARAQAGTAELEGRWRELREAAAVKRGDAEAAAMAWVRERQDAETRLQLYRDREKELRGRLRKIREGGEDAECVNCGRPLGDRAGAVTEARREEWEDVVQDGKWWRQRRDQLELKPDELKEIESRALSLDAEIEDLSEEIERRKVRALELATASERLEQLRGLEARLGEGSGGAQAGEAGRDDAGRSAEAARERVRAKVHARLVALTGGRFAGAFPELYAEWIAGGLGSGEDTAALEVAARITLAEIAIDAGVEMESVLLPTGLERLNGEDLPRALADLVRLAKRIPLVLVKATARVVAGAPESFDLVYRLENTGKGRRVRSQRPGLASIWLQGD